MGSSREIAVGPVAVVSLLLGTLLQNEIDHTTHPVEYLRLSFTATFFAGIAQATLGILRLGFLIDFLSHAAIVGFMAGAAITIARQQLKGFLGIHKFSMKTDIISVMNSVFDSAEHGWNWQTIVIGVFLTFLLICKLIGKKNKKLFWVLAIAPLISVVLSIFFVYITHADKKGIDIVRHIKKALTEAIAIGRTFAAMDYQIDGNKEMVALRTMNVIGSMTSCYVTTGSFSRSAVNFMAGCQTAVSNIVMSTVVFLTLMFLTPLFKLKSLILLLAWEPFLVLYSRLLRFLIAVSISFAKILLQVTRPRTATLGKIPRTTVYRNIQQYPDASKVPGILIMRVDSAIYFSNSNYVKERILRWLTDEEEQIKAADLPPIHFLIVEMSRKQFFYRLVLANPGPVVIDKLHASKFTTLIGENGIFLTAADAVVACSLKFLEEV
ncbi:High affinity sulfate transporter [Parasponia andersonii]|uniref:High affinity sulfate transporter n=1 Tax=Parasponia andersonii TaxID=3476 RepID=A0A2P5BM36_PARAD|nr:High affinity sulfate transporter [Parasponia andersonii]